MKISTVQEKFNQAPEKIQDIVMSVDTSEALSEIEKKYEVYKEENGLRILPKETADVLIGITHPKDFVPMLVEKLDISKEKAQEVAKEVNQKIFSQVKDLLIELHGLKKTQITATETLSTSLKNNIPTPPIVPQKSPAPPQKKGFAEIKIPQKTKVSELKPELKKDLSGEKPKIPTPPPLKGGEIKIPVPPSVPQKPVVPTPKNHSIHSGHAPKNSPSLISEQAPKVALGENTQVEKSIPVPSQKIPVPPAQNMPAGKQIFSETKPKNPFEEKLRQTFTIPKKDPLSEQPQKTPESENTPPTPSSNVTKPVFTSPKLSAEEGFTTPEPLAKAGAAKGSGEAKPAVAESYGGARKKEEIKNNPYLETID